MSVFIFIDHSKDTSKKLRWKRSAMAPHWPHNWVRQPKAFCSAPFPPTESKLGGCGAYIKIYHCSPGVSQPPGRTVYAKLIADTWPPQATASSFPAIIPAATAVAPSCKRTPESRPRLRRHRIAGHHERFRRQKDRFFSGKAFANISLRHRSRSPRSPQCYSVKKVQEQRDRSPDGPGALHQRYKWVSVTAASGEIVLYRKQNSVVSGGRGLKDPRTAGMITELAHLLGAATACSRPWQMHTGARTTEHVGQTGSLSPPISSRHRIPGHPTPRRSEPQ